MIVTDRLCIQLPTLSFVGVFIYVVIHLSVFFRLTCKTNIIYHFYCDVIPLLKISCIDTSFNYLMLLIFSGSIQVFTIVNILVSYTFVLFTILKRKSEKRMRKEFSTCGAHPAHRCVCTIAPFSSCMFIMDLYKQMTKIWFSLYFTWS
jgi:olfactory receptor